MATTIRPKESKGALEPTPNTFAVENGVLYDYYPVKLGERRGDFVDLAKLPPILREGYVTYQRKLFKVELRDFLRSRVNVGQQPYTVPGADTTSDSSNTASDNPTLTVDNASAGTEQSRIDGTFGVQVNEAADLAWQDQVATLLYLDDPEEEWQLPTAPQS